MHVYVIIVHSFYVKFITLGCVKLDADPCGLRLTIDNKPHLGDMAAKKTLEDLQQEIMCSLCLDTFEDPRVLPCQHVNCKACLEGLASRGGNVSPHMSRMSQKDRLVGGRCWCITCSLPHESPERARSENDAGRRKA